MLKSMTGYGRASREFAGTRYIIEIKSVNNKVLNLSLRTPLSLQEHENELRSELSKLLERGSVIVNIDVDHSQPKQANVINGTVVADYYHQIETIAKNLSLEPGSSLGNALRMPGIFSAESNEMNDEFWSTLLDGTMEAMKHFDQTRLAEGAVLEDDFIKRIEKIKTLLVEVGGFEYGRIDRIKSRIRGNLSEFIENEKIDWNRFEQEMVYYIEQLDFTEEKVRLAKHCEYFMETIRQAGPHGKKLDFIAQEIGREINTLGSKARDADIQKIVVEMKDELEKIKEQLANIL